MSCNNIDYPIPFLETRSHDEECRLFEMVAPVSLIVSFCCSFHGRRPTLSHQYMPHNLHLLSLSSKITGMCVKGLERGIMRMSTGERARISISATYGYGSEGIRKAPHIPKGSYSATSGGGSYLIPPDVPLTFEVTLLSFWTRPAWLKPTIQAPGLSQKPYHEEDQPSYLAIGNSRPVKFA